MLRCTQWSWRESNPRPNIFVESFLHAYFIINCRHHTGNEQTNMELSWIVLIPVHSLTGKHSVLFLSRRRSSVTEQPASAALMTAKSLIRQPWHTEYCHLMFEYPRLKCRVHRALHAYTFKDLCCRNRDSPFSIF
jgi:hypothetical protein